MPELGTHSREALEHWLHIGFFSSHLSFLERQVRLWPDRQSTSRGLRATTCHPVRERISQKVSMLSAAELARGERRVSGTIRRGGVP